MESGKRYEKLRMYGTEQNSHEGKEEQSMKKTGKIAGIGLLCLVILGTGSLIAGKIWRNPAAIPSLEALGEHDEAFAHKKLEGHLRNHVNTALGEPDRQTEYEDIWLMGPGKRLKVSYNNSQKAAAVGLQVKFMDGWYSVSGLSEETLDWLEWYHVLTEEEQLCISFVPGDLLELRGISEEDTAAEETETEPAA